MVFHLVFDINDVKIRIKSAELSAARARNLSYVVYSSDFRLNAVRLCFENKLIVLETLWTLKIIGTII